MLFYGEELKKLVLWALKDEYEGIYSCLSVMSKGDKMAAANIQALTELTKIQSKAIGILTERQGVILKHLSRTGDWEGMSDVN